MSDFSSLNLHSSLLEEIKNIGHITPTPIQAQSIPHLMAGKDLLGIAQTGTGKTGAFSLPILNRLAANEVILKPNRVRTLILSPTRELASQIEANIKSYGKGFDFSTLVVFGGVSKQAQIDKLALGLDIMIATPGRLLDLMSDGHIIFDQLEVFVLDEADTMLDMGFLNDVKKIISFLPPKKQTLLFSATMPADIGKLATSLLNNPVKVEVTPESSTVDNVEQKICFIEKANKTYLLLSILDDPSIESVLLFVKTKFGADRMVELLEKSDITSAAIHSNKTQGVRERSLSEFREGKTRVLVATDVAARGIDISHIGHVINFNLPEDPKNYIHRIGRTARAGRKGMAISFCTENELPMLKNIEKLIKQKLPVDLTQPFHKEFTLEKKKLKARKKTKSKKVNRFSR